MNILTGESTEVSGDYSLFTENQILSFNWRADPVSTKLSSIRDRRERVIIRTTQADTATESVADAQKVLDGFKKVVASIKKTDIVDFSDLDSLDFNEKFADALKGEEGAQPQESPDPTGEGEQAQAQA